MHRHQDLEAKQQEIATMHAKLEGYHDLPPDMTAAQAVYDSKLQRLRSTTRALAEGLGQL